MTYRRVVCAALLTFISSIVIARAKPATEGIGYVERFQHHECWERSACPISCQWPALNRSRRCTNPVIRTGKLIEYRALIEVQSTIMCGGGELPRWILRWLTRGGSDLKQAILSHRVTPKKRTAENQANSPTHASKSGRF